MCEEVFNVIRRWQSDERLTALSEARICSAVIVPILRGLDWDIANPEEVWEQYPVEEIGTVDYALLIGNEPKVLVEVKRGGESLDRHQSQIRNYARIGGVSLATLTNGSTWQFYLPLQEGSWERARVGDVVFHDQNAAENTQKLVDLLSRENVSSENAIRNAENLQEKNRILEALPNAWEQLVNDMIPDLLAEKTQELCGHTPDQSTVEQFLSIHLQQVSVTPPPATREVTAPAPQRDSSDSSERTTCQAFEFRGDRHEVLSWRGMLVKLCEIIHNAHRDRFGEVLNLRGKGGAIYFSGDSIDFIAPKPINETGVFVEVSLSAKEIKKRARALINHFGYGESDLSYETRTS